MRITSLNCAIIFFIALPIIANLIFTIYFSVNVPFSDDWRNVPYIQRWYEGTFSPEILYNQHGEHRPLFGMLIKLLLARLTHYNLIVQIIFSWLFLLSAYSTIAYVYMRSFGRTPRALAGLIPIGFLFFNVRQVQTLLHADAIIITLALAASLLSIVLVQQKSFSGFVGALISAIIASYSFMIGLFVWPVNALYLFINHKRLGWLKFVLWTIMSVLVWILYFYHWVRPGEHPSPLFFIHHLGDAALFYFILVGSPFILSKTIAFILGLLIISLLGLLIFFLRRLNRHVLSQWTYMGIFFMLIIVSIVIGRSGFGTMQALETRYITFSTFFSILFFIYIYSIPRIKFLSHGFIVAALCVGLISATHSGIQIAKYERGLMQKTAEVLRAYPNISDKDRADYLPFVPDAQIEFLENEQLTLFHNRRK